MRETFEESREKLPQLTNVPVDEEYAQRFTTLLESHGAICTRTKSECYRSEEPARTICFYTIDFPEGTYREYGMQLLRSAPWTIYFPDGFKQPGADLYKQGGVLEDHPTVCLYLLKEQ